MQNMMKIKLKDGRTTTVPDNAANRAYFERYYTGCTFESIQKQNPVTKPIHVQPDETVESTDPVEIESEPAGVESTEKPQRGRRPQTAKAN